MAVVFIGLGSNQGDSEELIGQALMHLRALPDVKVVALSPLYESPALLRAGDPPEWDKPFLNAVAALHTGLLPHSLLDISCEIEYGLGRQRKGDWSPRPIDLDILAYDDHVLDSDALTLPHPGVPARDFVLLPWRDIAPEWRYPAPGPAQGKTIAQLCDALESTTAIRRPDDDETAGYPQPHA